MQAGRRLLVVMSMVVATVLPLSPVSAHPCVTAFSSPSCDGAWCPPWAHHAHTNLIPPQHCSSRPISGPCPDQPVHNYGAGGSAGGRSATVTGGDDFGVGVVTVTDTNTADCGTGPAGWDGDYDWGVGGGAFGYGAWATDPDCNYLLNVHGPNVVVNDAVFGSNIGFVVGEDDQGGPVKIPVDADGDGTPESVVCETSGSISPCSSTGCDPTDDSDDCLSDHFVGTGFTCGSGGGDGLYWVFLDGFFVDENGGVSAGNPPTTGTITAF